MTSSSTWWRTSRCWPPSWACRCPGSPRPPSTTRAAPRRLVLGTPGARRRTQSPSWRRRHRRSTRRSLLAASHPSTNRSSDGVCAPRRVSRSSWTHADDIRRAIGAGMVVPPPASLLTMAELACGLVPRMLAARGVRHATPGGSSAFGSPTSPALPGTLNWAPSAGSVRRETMPSTPRSSRHPRSAVASAPGSTPRTWRTTSLATNSSHGDVVDALPRWRCSDRSRTGSASCRRATAGSWSPSAGLQASRPTPRSRRPDRPARSGGATGPGTPPWVRCTARRQARPPRRRRRRRRARASIEKVRRRRPARTPRLHRVQPLTARTARPDEPRLR